MKDELLLEDPAPIRLRGRSKEDVTTRREPSKIVGVALGKLVGLESGEPIVDFPANESGKPLAALSILRLSPENIGLRVVLMFEGGNSKKPVVMGLVYSTESKHRPPLELTLDKQRLVFTAEQEILLRCGKASITLTRAGKVLIRGAYILTRSSGVNRIKGGSVQIN